ncbi:MAG TPA: phosphate ABC transporter permease PstA [Candidatus Limnocylindrales bacterium]|nr:phosphate ABC transporter permease PstA [Candidatus Limnocylindrales bacterium]
MAISSLLFISGAIAALPGVIHLINAFSKDGYTLVSSSALIADIAFSFLIIVPAFVFFAVGYLLLENHSMGWKLSYATGAIALLLGLFKIVNWTLALPIVVLVTLAATVTFRDFKSEKRKDYPVVTENLAKFGIRLSGFICITILLGLLVYIAIRASPYLSANFLTSSTWTWKGASFALNDGNNGSLGGIAGYTAGSLVLVFFCEIVAVPLGLGAAIYMSEYASQGKLTSFIRFFIETLAGIPSVIIGLVGLAIFVFGGFKLGVSIVGGGLSLAFMTLPWNVRVVEEAIRAVPASYREASFALGATKWQTVRRAVLFAALPGMITGILLGFGAALGETIVVAMTAGDAPPVVKGLPTIGLRQPIPTLTVFIWRAPILLGIGAKNLSIFNMYGVAFAAAFVLIVIYLAVCIVALIARNYLSKKVKGA